ncbi:flavin-containing monooxygenase [Paenibacillus puerhi]|uniref:flavin-containing monooxygenase n=1 Tax=Paenibacillus puerhi TaxID=2692622 RepID=UPI001F25A930|nr:NAD(P)/FAD-dependent oxidoreductase [Paenibacillus puerhi]
MAEQSVQVVIVGAGQAGLAAAYQLRKQGISFVCLDSSSEAGESWRVRYDSLTLFTPRRCSELPGLSLTGDPDGFPTKDEIADYLYRYKQHFDIPVRYDARVTEVALQGRRFRVQLATGESLYADQLLVATGPFQEPAVPKLSASLDESVLQLHSSAYRYPGQLQPGPVLVVGAGNSGAQIALELAEEGREVWLSASERSMRVLPLRLLGRSIFYWMDRLGLLHVPGHSLPGRWLRKQPDPIFGRGLAQSIRQGAIGRLPRATGASGRAVRFADGSSLEVPNIIWATGFHSDYSWLQVDGALDGQGGPLHQSGVSPVRGLFYIGLPWMRSRASALIRGAAGDALYVTAQMEQARGEQAEREALSRPLEEAGCSQAAE